MAHQHTYDAKGKQLCCLQEETYTQTGIKNFIEEDDCCGTKKHRHDEHDHGHDHSGTGDNIFKMFMPAVISIVLLLAGIAMDHWFPQTWFTGWVRGIWYVVAYIPVGLPVLKEAVESMGRGDVFSEFFLMGIATIGAFDIGDYTEGVAVMLFYIVGEVFQTMAVSRAKSNI